MFLALQLVHLHFRFSHAPLALCVLHGRPSEALEHAGSSQRYGKRRFGVKIAVFYATPPCAEAYSATQHV